MIRFLVLAPPIELGRWHLLKLGLRRHLPVLSSRTSPQQLQKTPGADLGIPRGGLVRKVRCAQPTRAASPRQNIEITAETTKHYPKAQKWLVSQSLKIEFRVNSGSHS
jgi:hypothetical protein